MTVLSSSRLHDHGGMHRLWILVGLTVGLLLLPSQRSLAQEFRATLTGQVTDPTGAVIAKAKVTATNNDTGSTYTDATSNAGVYFIPYVLPGTYTVKVEAEGFKTSVQDKVLLLAGKYFGQNFKLAVGSFHDTVEVTDAPPMLETANGSGEPSWMRRPCKTSRSPVAKSTTSSAPRLAASRRAEATDPLTTAMPTSSAAE